MITSKRVSDEILDSAAFNKEELSLAINQRDISAIFRHPGLPCAFQPSLNEAANKLRNHG
jgi:hypothetical protein